MDKYAEIRVPIAHDNPSIKRRENKCVLCGKCKDVCKNKIGVACKWTYDSENIICINCGQCVNVCPVGSLEEKDDTNPVMELINNQNKIVVFITSPAVRVSLGEMFGYSSGQVVTGQMVSALKKLGADYVYDVTFGADLTIMEEASELIERIKNGGTLPQFTSCCPAWVKFVETFYPEYIPNLSTCRSPISMQASVIKHFLAKKLDKKAENISVVAVTPCVAKKFEITRPELSDIYGRDTDYVISVRELGKLLKRKKINLKVLEDSKFDSALPLGTGAGVIFGASGGVMEAAVRTAYYLTTGEMPTKNLLEFKALRGYKNVKTATMKLLGQDVKLLVIFGTATAREVLAKLNKTKYHMIEVMACPNGCVGGGGQPLQNDMDIAVINRAEGLYNCDRNMKLKNSFENAEVKKLYDEFLTAPLSEKAKKYLHTTYNKR